ncbi:MAG: anaerobic ribonucleoside-triphosphate reductase activating protein [Patescibacteria group bacterium]|nr:anaerobic ribonucleoside-triphosphate reductase activating protein [Patescibacteria group bacterium]
MDIGGLQETTLLDYPGKVACTVFLIGCNFRCPFCYSGELVLPEKIKLQPRIPENKFFEFLEKRKNLLDGCVVCGGEPTIHQELPDFIRKIKSLGYLVKMDTNGSNPKMLKNLIDEKLIDYVAMDVKSPLEKYNNMAGVKVDTKKIQGSINILKEEIIDFEFRTTVIPTLIDRNDVVKIAHLIGDNPSADIKKVKYYLQNFRAEKTIDPKFEKIKSYPDKYLLDVQKEISSFFKICEIR